MFWTRVELRPGHVVKKPAVIAAQWRYSIMSDLVERVWTLFEHGEC